MQPMTSALARRAARVLSPVSRTQHCQAPVCAALNRGLQTNRRLAVQANAAANNVKGAGAAATSHTPAIIDKLAGKIRDIAPEPLTETYRAYSKGKELYQECAKQASYMGPGVKVEMPERAKFWYTDCQRPLSFNSWAQVTMLHMWTLVVRFRAYPSKKSHDIWMQHFIDHFFYDAEEKMTELYQIKSSLRSQYLKDLFVTWRGLVAAYDEGLARHRFPLNAEQIGSAEAEGDAVLAAAIWRNIFDARPETDLAMLTAVTAYVRRIVSGLEKLPDEAIMDAAVMFGEPRRDIAWGLEGSK